MDLKLHKLLPFIPAHLARKIIADPFWDERADCDRVAGAILFADISGFTPLTEELANYGKEGPEELSRLLNEYFSELIDILESESGEVVKFSGDALMVLFPAGKEGMGIAVRRAEQAARRLQAQSSDSPMTTSLIGDIELRIKIGIGCGEVVAMEVGGLLGRWEYVIAGAPIEQAALCESQAAPGDVLLSPEAQEVILAPSGLDFRPCGGRLARPRPLKVHPSGEHLPLLLGLSTARPQKSIRLQNAKSTTPPRRHWLTNEVGGMGGAIVTRRIQCLKNNGHNKLQAAM